MKLEFLRAAADATVPGAARELVPGILRFTLEYRQAFDIAAETERLARLIGAGGFEFFPLPPGEDPLMAILQFPGVPRQQSASFLFELAQSLVEGFGLNSCVPDVDPGWIAGDELDGARPESVGGIVWALCKSKAAPPGSPTWAVAKVRADEAWRRFGARGEGILIGQPDTGVADHREIDHAIDLGRGTDVIAGGGRPIDPLAPGMGDPGHGTATCSVVASRTSLRISGVAPGATVVPIRCIDSVVIGSGAAVAAAVDHARLAGCHIVTMSLGGPIEGADLRRSIARAVAADMIILAAAGNCVPFVVYPAWDANVIAVAGIDEDDRPWKGTSRGRKIDVSAPGENVYVARRSRPTDMDKSFVLPGQGTSFAVAVTAGCAALWLSRFSAAAARREAGRRGTSVQELFRAALRATARRPAGWDSSRMGAGIVDATNLLAMPLEDVPEIARTESAHPGNRVPMTAADAGRFAAEIGYLAADRAQRRIPRRDGALETCIEPTPSRALARSLRMTREGRRFLRPISSFVISPLTPYVGPENALRLLARSAPGLGAESLASEARVRTYLEGAGGKAVLDRFEARLKRLDPARDANPKVAALRRNVISSAERVLTGFARSARTSADFTGMDRITAEALVRLTGRPALRVVDGMIDPQDPQIEEWAGDLVPSRQALKPLVDAVGRIDVEVDGEFRHVGSGSVIGKGLVMTNRHVIEAFAEPVPARGGSRRFLLRLPVSICFDEQAMDPSRRFRITGVVAAGPDAIGRFADIRKLDLALLEVETANTTGRDLPVPVGCGPLVPETERGRKIVIVGYPARPSLAGATDPATGRISTATWDRLRELFQNDYGFKYLCPGEISAGPGDIAGDVHRWTISHDATTLGGSSGAPVIGLDLPFVVGGLHFGGQPLRQNLGHGLIAVKNAIEADPTLMDPAAFGHFLRQ